MIRRQRRNASFTLLELMVAIAILMVIMLALYQVSNQISRSWQMGERRTETTQSARLILEMMARELEGAVATSNSPTAAGKTITIFHDEDSTIVPGLSNPNAIAATPPNDQIFFISNAADTFGQSYADLAEYGYMVVYARSYTNYFTMQGGSYYLLRHFERSHNSSGVNSAWDFFSNLPSGWGTGWPTSTVLNAQSKTPILENVIRFELRYEVLHTNNPTYGTDICETWRNDGSGSPKPSAYGIAAPTNVLPRAAHIQLSMLDRRAAARMASIISTLSATLPAATWAEWTNGIPSSYLSYIPVDDTGTNFFFNCTACPWTNQVVQPLRNILHQDLQTYYRSVHFRNAR
jgi:type II secretory pathway pseudopilin PulG